MVTPYVQLGEDAGYASVKSTARRSAPSRGNLSFDSPAFHAGPSIIKPLRPTSMDGTFADTTHARPYSVAWITRNGGPPGGLTALTPVRAIPSGPQAPCWRGHDDDGATAVTAVTRDTVGPGLNSVGANAGSDLTAEAWTAFMPPSTYGQTDPLLVGSAVDDNGGATSSILDPGTRLPRTADRSGNPCRRCPPSELPGLFSLR